MSFRGLISKEGNKTSCVKFRQSHESFFVNLHALRSDKNFPEHISHGIVDDLTPTTLIIVYSAVTVSAKYDTAVEAASVTESQ